MENKNYEGGFVLDLMDIFHYLVKKSWIIAIVTAVCLIGSFLVSRFLIAPEYTAGARVYVLNQSNDSGVVVSDFQVSSQLLNDFRVLITGQNVTQEVVEDLGLDMSPSQLCGKISVNAPGNTRVLEIKVTDNDPQLAADIANCVQKIASRQITEIMGLDSVKLVYSATVPGAPSSPNISKNTATGAVLGFVLSTALCICYYLFDDTIRTEDDVMKYLELSTLGSIPDSSQLSRDNRSKKKKSHSTVKAAK